ncbi:MAG: P-II family nitrogen regulator [Lachnospiraceae bacterium]|jgi:nitrogen regulatory protein PII|nr:P-II family nitrogen regulator [Lachnospiraceae bacterium]
MDNKALFIVINAGFSEAVLDIARELGVTGATVMNARGEGLHHASILGITVDTEKEIIVTITDGETADKVMAAVKEQAGVNTPAHGVCFLLPVEAVAGIN